jgi:hypothetical protein
VETDTIQRVLRARYGGVEASDVLIQFARIELERPDALVWMQNGKFCEIYGDAARLLGRLLDLRVAEKPLMTGRERHPFGLAIGSNGEPSGQPSTVNAAALNTRQRIYYDGPNESVAGRSGHAVSV